MEIAVFDGEEDAYWWILCTEKFFAATGTPEAEKMTTVVPAMRGHALNWWRWWYHHHPQVSWDSFTGAFLWRFKPEFRDVLPISDDEEEPNSESWDSVLTAPDDFLLPTDQIEVFSLKDDPVERLAMAATFVEHLPPPKPEVQLAQLETEATNSQVQQNSSRTTAGDQKSANPALRPPPPKPPESDTFTGLSSVAQFLFTGSLAAIPSRKPPDRVSVSFPLPPPPKPPDRNVTTSPPPPFQSLNLHHTNLLELDATWEDKAELRESFSFPNFNLEGKVLDERSNDTGQGSTLDPRTGIGPEVLSEPKNTRPKSHTKAPAWIANYI